MKTPEQIATAAGVVIGPGTFACGTNHVHKVGSTFRLDGKQVEVVGRVPDQRRTYIFARVIETIAARDHREATAKARGMYEAGRDATIPRGYRTRHGSLYGGTVQIGEESFREVAISTTDALQWRIVIDVREICHAPGTLIHGTVQEYRELWGASMPDGRPIYREVSSHSFGDDVRQTYWMPLDVWTAAVRAEIVAGKITPESAREWLAQYRGCVGSEVYEFAVSDTLADTMAMIEAQP